MTEATAELSLTWENRSSVVGGVTESKICLSGGIAGLDALPAGSWGEGCSCICNSAAISHS